MTGLVFGGMFAAAQTAVIPTPVQVAGTGVAGFGGDGGPATSAEISSTVTGLAVDAAGDIYIADTGNNRVREINHATGVITTIAGNGTAGYAGDGGQAATAELSAPSAVAVAPSGRIYIADSGNCRVRTVDLATGEIATVAGSGPPGTAACGYSGDGGPATAAQIAIAGSSSVAAGGIALDSAGNLYISDVGNYRIREVAANGTISTIAGNGTPGNACAYTEFSIACQAPGPAEPFRPDGMIAADGAGDVYIGDTVVVSDITGTAQPYAYALIRGPQTDWVWKYSAGAASGPVEGNILLVSNGSPIPLFASTNVFIGSLQALAGAGSGLYLAGDMGLIWPELSNIPMAEAIFDGSAPALPNAATALAVDPGGDIYFADDGTVSMVSGAPPPQPVVVPFPAAALGSTSPASMTVLDADANEPSATGVFSFSQAKSLSGYTGTGCSDGNVAALCDLTFAFTPANGPGPTSGAIDWGPYITPPYPGCCLGYGVALGPALAFSPGMIATTTGTKLDAPSGLAFWSGTLYVADAGANKVFSGGTVVAGNGAAGFSGDGGTAAAAELNAPMGVAVDGWGNVYIADSKNNRIREVAAATGAISTVAGDGAPGFSGDGGAATAAELNDPEGVAIDAVTDNLYIADTGNARVRVVSAETGSITTIAGGGTGAAGNGDNGPATAATLQQPVALAFDTNRNLYIADAADARVRAVNLGSGIITTYAGDGTAGFNGDGETAATAELNEPSGLAVDAANDLYIADAGNDSVRFVASSNDAVSTVVGNGTAGYAGDGGAATSAELNAPRAVALDTTSDIYVADTGNQAVRLATTLTAVLNFGTVNAGTSSPPLTALVTNVGNQPADVDVNPFSEQSFALQPNSLNGCQGAGGGTAPLAPGASCVVEMTFTPSTTASVSQTAAAQVNSEIVIELTGTVAFPNGELSPVNLNFQNENVGSTTAAQTVTLANPTATAALPVGSITVSGPFTQSNNCGASVAAGGTCTISVSFAPTTPGSATGSLTVNAGGGEQTATLAGTGMGADIELTGGPVAFGGQYVGTSGLPQNLTVLSNGNEPLTISAITTSAGFGYTTSCNSPVAAGTTCTIAIFFDPTAPGSETGTLVITDSAASGSQQTVSLSGSGEDFSLAAAGAQSAAIAAGQSAQFSLQLTGLGGFAQTVALTCAGTPPSGGVCVVSPATVAATSAASAVNVTVGGPAAISATGHDGKPRGGLTAFVGQLALLSLAVLGLPGRRRASRAAAVTRVAAATGLLLALSGCGGGPATATTSGGAPATTYSFSVIGTFSSGATTLTHQVGLTVTVE